MTRAFHFFSGRDFFNRHAKPFIKYGIVGVIGTAVDVGALYALVELGGLPVLPATAISFLLAVVNNFILNKIWTFRHPSKNYKKLFIKFLIVSLVGLGLTLGSMYVFVYVLGIWYILSKIITSLLVLTWNFLANKLWTFQALKTGADESAYARELSIVVPSYNEAKRIGRTLEAIDRYLRHEGIDAEVIVVDDGSRDRTTEVVTGYQAHFSNLSLERLDKNSGKGAAVRAGVERAVGEFILFVDADNSTPIEEFGKLRERQRRTDAHLVIGSRYLESGSVKIKQPKYRVLLGRIGNLLIRTFLIEGIADTQCGFKLLRAAVAKDIFSFQKVRRFGFDMEALVVAKNLGYTIEEVPVDWFNSADSRLRPVKDGLITLKDLVFIKLNLWAGRYNRG